VVLHALLPLLWTQNSKKPSAGAFGGAIERTMRRLKCRFDEIAITNVSPFAIYDAERPALRRSDCPTWPKAVRDFLRPWLSATGAGTVIWLGKGACRTAERHWREVPVDAVVNRDRGSRWPIDLQTSMLELHLVSSAFEGSHLDLTSSPRLACGHPCGNGEHGTAYTRLGNGLMPPVGAIVTGVFTSAL
jgi:hypothetical protein